MLQFRIPPASVMSMPSKSRLRGWWIRLLVMCTVLWVGGCAPKPIGHLLSRVDHVVVVVVDTVRADHTSVNGYERALTPRLSELGERGLVFERAHAHSAWTLPSFASLFTGVHPHKHGAMRIGSEYRFSSIDSRYTTLAETYEQQGIRTGLFAANAFVPQMWRGFTTRDESLERKATQTVAIALKWITSSAAPSFTVVTMMEPHQPYAPDPEFKNAFIDPDASYPLADYPPPGVDFNAYRTGAKKPNPAQLETLIALYDAEIATADHAFGQLIDGLSRAGLLDDTIVVYTSDHGEEFWDHDTYEHGHALYGEITRVPLVVAGPGIPSGRVATPVQHVDLYQWLVEMSGHPRLPETDGRSLWDVMEDDRAGEANLDRPLLTESTMYGDEMVAVTVGAERMMVNVERSDKLSKLWTLDANGQSDAIIKDPTEAQVELLLTALIEMRGHLDPPVNSLDAEQTLEHQQIQQLQQLGYLD